MSVYRRIQSYFTIIQLLIIFSLFFNNIAFQHKHSLSNGDIVVHSHPYAKKQKSQEQHSHNNNQLQIISLVNHALWHILILITLIKYLSYFPSARSNNYSRFNKPIFAQFQYQLRAPPSI